MTKMDNLILIILIIVGIVITIIMCWDKHDTCSCENPITVERKSRMIGIFGKGGHMEDYFVCKKCNKELK